MFTSPVGPVEVFFYWPEAVFWNFYWPWAIGSPLASSPDIYIYYTSRENTLIPLDESHVSKLLATCVSVGSLTVLTIRRISTRCQGDDVLAPVVKVPFHDSLYC